MDNQAPGMGADPMGGNASFMGVGDPSMGMDPNAGMGGTGQDMGGDPSMGADPFGGGGNEMTDDPEKEVESLVGQAASIIRKDMNSDGINKHEDKKKEVLGMLVSAITDGMDDEERNGIIDYLSDKVNGSGESDGDTDGGSEDASMDMQDDQDMSQDMNQDMGQDAGMPQDGGQAPMLEEIVNEITNGILDHAVPASKKARKPKSNIGSTDAKPQGYKAKPFKR